MWKRTTRIPSFSAGTTGRQWPDYFGSWLTHRDQWTSEPGKSPWFDRLRPFIEDEDGNPIPYYLWTQDQVINAFKGLREQLSGVRARPDEGCPQCGDRGIFRIRHEDEAWDCWCLCTLTEKVNEWYSTYSRYAFPFEPVSWGNYVTRDKDPSLKTAYSMAKLFALNPQYWLIFSGSPGVGKTHLLRTIYNSFGPGVALATRVIDFSQQIWTAYRNSEDLSNVLDIYRYAPVLLLDDLGAAYMKVGSGRDAMAAEGNRMPFVMSMLHDVLDYRWNKREMLPTVITTNETLDSFRSDTWGILGDRIADSKNAFIGMFGASYRQSQENQNAPLENSWPTINL